MIAIKRLQNILWIMVVAFGALGAYLVSLRVATERNAVVALERRIASERSSIRYLETEFEARANMRQLERWNSDDYRYVAPQAAQYLSGERALASLDQVPTNGDSYVAPPVMMAMVDSEADVPAAAAPVTATFAAPVLAPATQVRTVPVAVPASTRTVRAPAALARAVATADPAPRKPAVRMLAARTSTPVSILPPGMAPAPARFDVRVSRGARVAMLDRTLLDDDALRDLGRKAAAENRAKGAR